ncbi:hypothetical protein EDC04DRAFT_2912662 [Pisolithus marmoratus]|nr:hypothetical protein EDC04DRAFT_2912662 [Pisolithus marmoratus]
MIHFLSAFHSSAKLDTSTPTSSRVMTQLMTVWQELDLIVVLKVWTATISMRSHDAPPEPIDLSLIRYPLPFSPVRTSSLTFSAGPGSSHSPTSLDIQPVQNALMMARENLAQKENALAQLLTEVEDLQRQIPNPSPP